MVGNSRKISVSFVSEALPTTSNDPCCGQGARRNPALKNVQQKILRLQVMQIVLGLTLMILSAMAIIEERILLGLGFSLISAMIIICCSVVGTQQTNPKALFLVHVVGLCGLIPAFNYTILSLHSNIIYRLHTNYTDPLASQGQRSNYTGQEVIDPVDDRSFTTTTWILGWAIFVHLLPMAVSLLYSSYLLKDIHFYQLAVPH